MPPLMQLPGFQYPTNALVNFKPITDAIESNQLYALKKRQVDMEQGRFDMQQHEADQRSDDRQDQRMAWDDYRSQPNAFAGMPEGYRNALTSGIMGPEAAAGAVSQYYQKLPEHQDAQARNALMRAELDERIRQAKLTHPLEAERLRLQVQEADQKANDPITALIRDTVRGQTQPQQGQPRPPQALSPQGLPGPRLMPQSNPTGPQDPNFIQAQAVSPQQQAQPPQAPQGDMVDIGLGKPIPVQTAKLMALSAYQKGNHQFGKYIEDQIGSQLEKSAKTELDKNRINYTQAIGRLDEINRTLDDSFLRSGTQLNQWFANAAEKAGVPMNPQTQQEAMKFHAFRANGIGHFNAVLKEMSGTAVSEQEFRRITAQLPNPGTGMFNGILDGDGPTQFRAKMAAATQSVKLAQARANFLAANGFKGDANAASAALPLEAMPQAIQRRTEMLQQQFTQQGVKPEMIPQAVQQQLKKDFGI